MEPFEWLGEKFDELFGGMHKKIDRHYELTRKETVFIACNGKTDANGDLELPFNQAVPAGKIFIFERVHQWADGKTPASVDSTGWTGLFHGPGGSIGALADYAPAATGGQVFPWLYEYNHNNAPRFKQGETPYFRCFGCIANTNISVIAQVCMESAKYRS